MDLFVRVMQVDSMEFARGFYAGSIPASDRGVVMYRGVRPQGGNPFLGLKKFFIS